PDSQAGSQGARQLVEVVFVLQKIGEGKHVPDPPDEPACQGEAPGDCQAAAESQENIRNALGKGQHEENRRQTQNCGHGGRDEDDLALWEVDHPPYDRRHGISAAACGVKVLDGIQTKKWNKNQKSEEANAYPETGQRPCGRAFGGQVVLLVLDN